jgi:hypothetical protein
MSSGRKVGGKTSKTNSLEEGEAILHVHPLLFVEKIPPAGGNRRGRRGGFACFYEAPQKTAGNSFRGHTFLRQNIYNPVWMMDMHMVCQRMPNHNTLKRKDISVDAILLPTGTEEYS